MLDTARRQWIPFGDGDKLGTVVHLMPAANGGVYAASLDRGVFLLDLQGHVISWNHQGLGGATRIAKDNRGQVWRAGSGVVRLVRRGAYQFWYDRTMVDRTSLDMEYDAKRDALWACFDKEVGVQERGTWTLIGRQQGLLDDTCRTVAVMPNGDAWIAYNSLDAFSIVHRESADRVQIQTQRFSAKNDSTIAFIEPDNAGRVWWARDRIDYISTPEQAAQGKWIAMTETEGLPKAGGNQNSLFADDDGSVWFASDNTITHFKPEDEFATDFVAPKLVLIGMTAAGKTLTLMAENTGLSFGGAITSHVGTLQFSRRESLHLRYRLLPWKTDWIETDGFDLALGKLLPGRYTLQVEGRLASGDWSEAKSRSFVVLWPIWLQWWALLGYSALSMGAAVGARQWLRRRKVIDGLTIPDLTEWRLDAMSPHTEELIGTVIDGRYEVGHVLSVGGFATVVRARDLGRGGQLCAVKIFRYELGDQLWVHHRFQHEVSALEQLKHPNIVRITGHGKVPSGAPYLVMEFIEGRSLRELLGNGPMPTYQIGRFLLQIGGALDALHRAVIYHRDLKPENVMVRTAMDGAQEYVLIDFSIAIVKRPDETFHGISRVAGTLGYMAPEQVTGYADASTDIHSLAKMVVEMLTGKQCSDLVPEAKLDLPKHIVLHFNKTPGVLSNRAIAMLASALEFSPTNRPHDVGVFAAELVRGFEVSP